MKFSIFHLRLEHIAHILRFLLTMAMSGDAWICVYCFFWVYRDPVSWHSWGSWLCGGHCQENGEALAVFCCSEFLFSSVHPVGLGPLMDAARLWEALPSCFLGVALQGQAKVWGVPRDPSGQVLNPNICDILISLFSFSLSSFT